MCMSVCARVRTCVWNIYDNCYFKKIIINRYFIWRIYIFFRYRINDLNLTNNYLLYNMIIIYLLCIDNWDYMYFLKKIIVNKFFIWRIDFLLVMCYRQFRFNRWLTLYSTLPKISQSLMLQHLRVFSKIVMFFTYLVFLR